MNQLTAFYSDPHFGHANVIKYSERPFGTAAEMNDALIENYNSVVPKNGVVLWLGDCFFLPAGLAASVMAQLNGTKLLVRGNHDRSAVAMSRLGFAVVAEETILCIAGKRVRATHKPYPREGAPSPVKGEVIIHGHTHSKKILNGNMVHLGVDAWNYTPALFADVEAMIDSL